MITLPVVICLVVGVLWLLLAGFEEAVAPNDLEFVIEWNTSLIISQIWFAAALIIGLQ